MFVKDDMILILNMTGGRIEDELNYQRMYMRNTKEDTNPSTTILLRDLLASSKFRV